MVLSFLDWFIIGLFLLITIMLVLYFRKRSSGSLEDFFLSGRQLPWYIAGISMVATTFAADTPLAVTELVAQNGIAGNWLWWNMLMGGLLTTFFFARLWWRAGVLTEVELCEFRYGGKAARFLRGFRALYLGLFMNLLIMAWVNIAFMSIIEIFFGVPSEMLYRILIPAILFVALYSLTSGLWGISFNDNLQFVIAMIGCIALMYFVLNAPEIGGIAGLKAQLPEGSLNFFPRFNSVENGAILTLSLSTGAFLAHIGVQWWASWYPGNEPGGGGYIAQRMMSTKDEKSAFWSVFLFQVGHYCIRPWPWIIVALATLILYPGLEEGHERYGFVMAMRDYLPAGWRGLLFVAFMAAYMSTISTQLNWGASYLVNDGYKRFISPNASEKKLVSISRLLTLGLAVASVIVTGFFERITDIWLFIIEAGSGLGLVLILRWYWWRINVWSELSAAIAPIVFYAIFNIGYGLEFPNSFFYTAICTTITWLTVTFLTRPESSDTLSRFFLKVKPQGFWKPVEEMTGVKAQSGMIKWLIAGWLSSIVMIYSILFTIGNFILQEWQDGLWSLISTLISWAILYYLINKKGILK